MTAQRVQKLKSLLADILDCQNGLALVEMAYSLPILITLTAGGIELANYATVQMRVSQLAVNVADNASRMGAGLPLASKRITETMINDVLSGAEAQASDLNLMGSQTETVNGSTTTAQKARIIISDLEPVANPNTTNRYKIVWQRCRGGATSYTPQYGTAGQTNLTAMGPAGRQVAPPDGTAMMFVEVHYRYQPLFLGNLGFVSFNDIDTVSAMLVRDDRDLTQIYNTEGATISSC
jgi:hypothetical protein